RTHRLAVGVYEDAADQSLVRTHRVELDVSGDRTEVPELVGVHRGKLVLVNDDDLTYCALRLDPQSLAVLIDRIGDIAEPLPRTLCWSAAWEMTREAELKARDFLHLVSTGIERETEIGVVQRLLLQAQSALANYAEPAWAAEHGWPPFADRLLELAQSAAPGSDHQLVFASALASSVLAERHQRVLRALLDGDLGGVGLDGLVVDTDLRWSLIQGLAGSGEIDASGLDTPEIDAEVHRDPTSAGERQGARARALRPQAESKAQAWQRAVHDDALSHTLGRAIIGGFRHPAQAELLKPYLTRYFDEVADVWARRSSEVAQTVVVGLFPSWSISPATVDAAEAFLGGDHPPALRRLVIEGRAGVVRSLAARGFDAG
ncbi:MAG: ERAP1-like C-terminal domain-containing protein, partial [Mycobacteriaceae bacterium]